uniref:BED-type domain-containing protein n=1 Tax=Romanomermis culicivorax TaxID=13658 RepID=A0A915ISS5_ROMCU
MNKMAPPLLHKCVHFQRSLKIFMRAIARQAITEITRVLMGHVQKIWACKEIRMATSNHSAVMRNIFSTLTTDERKAICNYCAKDDGQNKHGFGHSGLKKHSATYSPINMEYLDEQKSAKKNLPFGTVSLLTCSDIIV